MELIIRPFRAADLDPLYFLEQRCHSAAFRLAYRHLRDTLLDPEVSALVAETDQRDAPPIVAALVLKGAPAAECLHVITLMVDADFRRLGIAGRLLDWALRLAETHGSAALAVPLEQTNAAGAAFLTARGFGPTEEACAYFTDPQEGQLWVRPLEAQEAP